MDNAMAGPKRFAIIGGGISGLSAAAFLAKSLPDARIDLYEAASRCGGVLQTQVIDDCLIEQAADNFITTGGHVERLHKLLNLQTELISPNEDFRFAQVVCNGQIYPIPQGFSLVQPTRLWPVLRSPILSWFGRLRLCAERFVKRRNNASDESLRDFAVRRLGQEAFERLVEPIVGGIFTAQAHRLSMQAALPQFVAMELEYGSLIAAARHSNRKIKNVGAPNVAIGQNNSARRASGARYDIFKAPINGMSSWIDSIVAALPANVAVHNNASVQRLVRNETGNWSLQVNQIEVQFDGCILALPTTATSKLLFNVEHTLSDQFGKIRYASSAVATLLIQANQLQMQHKCFGIVMPTRERRDVLAISFASLKYAGRCDATKVLVRVFMGGDARSEILQWDDTKLIETAKRELQSLLKLRTEPIALGLRRWVAAMPQYDVGHLDRLASIESLLDKHRSLAVCGNAFRGVGIPQCINSGVQAAARIAGMI